MADQVVYKVVWIRDGKMGSCCLNSSLPEACRVTYELDKVTVPKLENSKLFAFETLRQAVSFLEDLCDGEPIRQDMRVLKCYTTNAVPPMNPRACRISRASVYAYWSRKLFDQTIAEPRAGYDTGLLEETILSYMRWAEGTLMCDDLEPFEITWVPTEEKSDVD